MRAARWRGAASALVFVMAGSISASAGDQFTLASGRADAPAYAVGVGLSSLIKFELLPLEKIDLQAQESLGAVDNVRLLETGDAQFAILPSATGHAARLGTGSFEGQSPAKSFRAIATLWRDALHLIVREDDVATGTIDDLSKMKDRKVFLGEASSGMIDANRLLFADLGMDADETFDLAAMGAGDAISAIKRGDVDAFSAAVRPPQAMFEDIFDDVAPGLRLLDVTETQMTRANGNHWLWTPYIIPAATYPGQNEDIWTIALSNVLVARTDVEPDAVYAITKSIFENTDYLKRVDESMGDLSLDRALAGMAMPLHPGALRYYNEVGLIPKTPLDDKAISPEPTPVKQDGERPDAVPEERYPDADVAGDLSVGAGGPLEKAKNGDPALKEHRNTAPDINKQPRKTEAKPEPHWRQRVTF